MVAGLSEVLDIGLLRGAGFDEGELELLLGGIGEVSVRDWRDNTEYRGGYTKEHK